MAKVQVEITGSLHAAGRCAPTPGRSSGPRGSEMSDRWATVHEVRQGVLADPRTRWGASGG
jgi:hypothetical protein